MRRVTKYVETCTREHETKIKFALVLLVAALLVWFIYSSVHFAIENSVIRHPTFVGTVVGKETRNIPTSSAPSMPRTSYHLHVVGEYQRNGETIQVDRVFTVSADMFHRYEIGDVINNKNRANARFLISKFLPRFFQN